MFRRLVMAAASIAVIAGCSSSSSPHSADVGPGPSRSELVAAANLRACPPSSSTAHGGLPDLTLPCLGAGPAVRLAGLVGKPTVVNVWGSWCIPCQRETALLSKTYDALRPQVRFLGIDTADSSDSALDFAHHVHPPMRYPSVVDPDSKVLHGLALKGLSASPGPPVTAFVNPAGQVVHVKPGQYTSAAELRHDIATYLHVSG
ncbi:MAG TPA: TlpA disulfide reductase family protein [Mycobacteriales bacterium]|nr:TlpA disulfide reductase family protein [Mycobacteriales bacterium]